ncbi:MAG: transcription repressor NadR [Lachnospiraceae bacterium]|nr:transcription repressor NadR [Lachnospiraceae bacterium]
MKGNERREHILKLLSDCQAPLSGTALARQVGCSRQVVVQDIALLRASNIDIISTNEGYLLPEKMKVSRVFKVRHDESKIAQELELIIDRGGIVKDIFVYHKSYGVLKADINVKSRLDIKNYIDDIKSGKSKPLSDITSGYHYHTVFADNDDILDMIQEELWEQGFLAKLQPYEPVDFGV